MIDDVEERYAEYQLCDRRAERAFHVLREAYEERRRLAWEVANKILADVISAESEGGDTRAVALAALEKNWHLINHEADSNVGWPKFLATARYNTTGYCNKQFERLGKPMPERLIVGSAAWLLEREREKK